MIPQPLSWKSAFSWSVIVHALLAAGIILLTYHAAPVGGSGMLTVELGGPGGSAGGLGDMHKDGQLGNGGSGGDGARNVAKEREINKTEEIQQEAPKTEGDHIADQPVQEAAPQSPDSEVPSTVAEPTPEPAALSVQKDGDVQVKDTVKKPLPKVVKEPEPKKMKSEAEPKPQPAKKKADVKPKVKEPVTNGKALSGETKKTTPIRDKAVASETNGKDGKSQRVNQGSGGAVGASGSIDGKGTGVATGVGNTQGSALGGGNFVANGDGTYTALGAGGITYKIVYESTPKYPREARSIGFNQVVRVRVKFLVGLKGTVETAEVLTKNVPNLGFKEAALAAIREMKFEPIYHHGINIKVFFRKTIVFQP